MALTYSRPILWIIEVKSVTIPSDCAYHLYRPTQSNPMTPSDFISHCLKSIAYCEAEVLIHPITLKNKLSGWVGKHFSFSFSFFVSHNEWVYFCRLFFLTINTSCQRCSTHTVGSESAPSVGIFFQIRRFFLGWLGTKGNKTIFLFGLIEWSTPTRSLHHAVLPIQPRDEAHDQPLTNNLN